MKFILGLYFDGQAKEALALYERAFGCRVETCLYYKDAVRLGWAAPDEGKGDLIFHSEVRFGQQEVRLGDLGGEERIRMTRETRYTVSLDSEEDVIRAFDALAEGGVVIRPLERPPFLVIIGGVRDRFGVNWELLCDYQ